MARRLIFKEGGLTGSIPSGYQAVGFNGATFSQLTSGGLFTSGGSGVAGTSGVNGTSGTSAAGGGGLTRFTEGLSTSAPNATVNIVSLTATASTTNVDVVIVPKGTGAFMLNVPDSTTTGGNKRGANAVDLQTYRTAANQVVSGFGSFASGYANIVSGIGSGTIGSSNVVSGNSSVGLGNQITCSNDSTFGVGIASAASGYRSNVIGTLSTASGQYSTCIGWQSITSAENSFVLGNNCTANGLVSTTAIGSYANVNGISGRQAFAQERIGASGDCQKSVFFFKLRTTNDTATSLYTDTNIFAPVSGKQINLSNQSSYRFKGTIIGKKSGTTDAACWDVDGLITRGANAASTTLNSSTVTLVSNVPGWGGPTLAADTTNGGLQIQVVGTASTNIQWTAIIETTEVIYS